MRMMNKKEVAALETEHGVKLSHLFVLIDWEGRAWVASRSLYDVKLSEMNVTSVGTRLENFLKLKGAPI